MIHAILTQVPKVIVNHFKANLKLKFFTASYVWAGREQTQTYKLCGLAWMKIQTEGRNPSRLPHLTMGMQATSLPY